MTDSGGPAVGSKAFPESLVLAEMDALTHEQIGEVLGVSREKVKALVFQAREALIASRSARETDCEEIREQLATARGGALRRGTLRRHLSECPGCRDYRREIQHQRRRIAAILPVAPTLALKEGILVATVGGAAAGAGGVAAGGGLLAGTSALKGLGAKALVTAVVSGLGTAGAVVAVRAVPALPTAPTGQAAPHAASNRGRKMSPSGSK